MKLFLVSVLKNLNRCVCVYVNHLDVILTCVENYTSLYLLDDALYRLIYFT